jgi:hypothetical protein
MKNIRRYGQEHFPQAISGEGSRGRRLVCVVWLALVTVAVLGRLWQPEWNGVRLWNVTPMVAVALAAGAVFANRLVAASVPLAALAIGNLAEPAYNNLGVAAVVFAASAWPALCGGFVQRGRWPAVLAGAVASSLVFFLATNFAHWLFTADYAHTTAGLVDCFTAALPFYRPLGDLAWTVGLFAGIAAITAAASMLEAAVSRRLQPAACRSSAPVSGRRGC